MSEENIETKTEEKECVVCKSKKKTYIGDSNGRWAYNLYKCDGCGLVFVQGEKFYNGSDY